jgi:hypothetical protein
MKTLIYSWADDSEEDPIARIVQVTATIRKKPVISKRTRQPLLRRCRLFI